MIRYIYQSQLQELFSHNTEHILASVAYGESVAAFPQNKGLPISINMPQVNEHDMLELWTSSNPVSIHHDKEMAMAYDGDMVMGSLEIEQERGVSLEETTCAAYQHILRSLSEIGYVHLVRIWNYFPFINAEENGRERYQRFCIGRHQAFSEYQADFQLLLPAASAVGTNGGPLHIDFLAGRMKGLHVENPRQISAYHYPKRYGPRSPSFARGTVYPMHGGTYFFVAGTASIVGHATQHVDDPQGQTKEALLNIDALVDYVRKEHESVIGRDLTVQGLKVYIRNPKDEACVKSTVNAHFGKDVAAIYLRGEMCRMDLLVEIEAIFTDVDDFAGAR